jgi:hypothetical protein
MKTTTLVVLSHRQIGERRFLHGDELPPDLLPREAIDLHLDRRELAEYDSADRRSLYRLFAPFSACTEAESLTQDELKALP